MGTELIIERWVWGSVEGALGPVPVEWLSACNYEIPPSLSRNNTIGVSKKWPLQFEPRRNERGADQLRVIRMETRTNLWVTNIWSALTTRSRGILLFILQSWADFASSTKTTKSSSLPLKWTLVWCASPRVITVIYFKSSGIFALNLFVKGVSDYLQERWPWSCSFKSPVVLSFGSDVIISTGTSWFSTAWDLEVPFPTVSCHIYDAANGPWEAPNQHGYI
jgi:hypothetical protein